MSTRFIVSIVISLIISISGGLLTNFVLDLSKADSFFAGLQLFLLSELFLLLLEKDKDREVFTGLHEIIENVKLDDRFSNYFISLVLESLKKSNQELTRVGIKINKQDVARIWTECIAHVNSSLVVCSYVNPKGWWDKDYADPNLILRISKARQNKTIRTLFLWNEKSEVKKLKPYADKMKEGGIIVSHVSLEHVLSDHIRKEKLKDIGHYDFGIIDGRWVFLHFLDKKRNTKSAIITSDPEIVNACQHFMDITTGNDDFNI